MGSLLINKMVNGFKFRSSILWIWLYFPTEKKKTASFCELWIKQWVNKRALTGLLAAYDNAATPKAVLILFLGIQRRPLLNKPNFEQKY